MQCCTLSPNNTFPTLPDAVVLLAIIALATLFCIAATIRVSAVRFAAHIPLAAVWIVLSFVKVATCDATGSCYRHEKKKCMYMLAWVCFGLSWQVVDKTYGWAKAKALAMAKGSSL